MREVMSAPEGMNEKELELLEALSKICASPRYFRLLVESCMLARLAASNIQGAVRLRASLLGPLGEDMSVVKRAANALKSLERRVGRVADARLLKRAAIELAYEYVKRALGL